MEQPIPPSDLFGSVGLHGRGQTDVEAERDNYQSNGGTESIHGTRFHVSPRLGMEWNSYVYHPYLLTYSLLFEPGYVWEQRTLNGQTATTDELMLDGIFKASLLESKPYSTTLSYSRAHQEVKYDLFNSAIVDSQNWGAFTGYREGPVPVNISFNQSHEDSMDFNQTAQTDQRTLNLEAKNERLKDNFTELTYQFNQFERSLQTGTAGFRNENSYQHLGLVDTEHFDRSTLQSTFRFNNRQSATESESDLNAGANYNLQHSPSLRSYYDLSFSRFAGDNTDSIQTYGVAGLQHQLYESLASGIEVHGSTVSSSTGPSSFDSQSLGTVASLDYTKRLGAWGRLSLSDSASYNFTAQQTTGTELLVPNESHTVPLNGLIRLSQPRQVDVLSVTTPNNSGLLPNLDYNINRSTDPLQLQIISSGPSHVQPGSVVLITYTILSNPSGTFATLGNQAQIRLSLWEGLFVVYSRFFLADSRASSAQFLLQDNRTFESGAEINWHGAHFTASYIDDRSTLFDSRTINLSESYSLSVSSDSTLGIDLNQQWSANRFRTENGTTESENLSFYDAMLRWQWRPVASLNWTAEAGYRRQRGFGLNENLFAARTYLTWQVGKVQLNVGYEHENQVIRFTSRDRDFAFLRARRSF